MNSLLDLHHLIIVALFLGGFESGRCLECAGADDTGADNDEHSDDDQDDLENGNGEERCVLHAVVEIVGIMGSAISAAEIDSPLGISQSRID